MLSLSVTLGVFTGTLRHRSHRDDHLYIMAGKWERWLGTRLSDCRLTEHRETPLDVTNVDSLSRDFTERTVPSLVNLPYREVRDNCRWKMPRCVFLMLKAYYAL